MERLDLEGLDTLPDALNAAARVCGGQVALQAAGSAATFGGLRSAAEHIALALRAAGCARQQTVGYIGTNGICAVELMFGVVRAGAVWAPMNWRLSRDVLHRMIAESDMRLCFADSAFKGAIEGACNRAGEPIWCVTTDEAGEFTAWLAHGKSQMLPEPPAAKDVAVQVYTSGTSGTPKGVMLSHAALLASRRMERLVGEPWSNWQPGEVNLVCMPNFHVSGALSVVAGIVNLGMTILLPQFEVGAVLDVLRATPPQRLLLVPSAIKLLLDDPRSADVDFSTIRFVMYGGSPMPETLMREIQARMQCGFVQFYGMTETSGRATYLSPELHVPGAQQRLTSAGRPFPGVQLAIRDGDGADLPAGCVGEVCIRSPSVMVGYRGREEATAAVLNNGWYRSGDVGYLDADGYLYLVDRLDDKIVTGGENVYPSEVENALRQHPAVADAAVCALPDPRWLEAVHAAVILRPGSQVDEVTLRQWVADRIGSYKAPKRTIVVASFPRGATGKVLRKELAQFIQRERSH